jgi:hypothetical protein
VDAVSTALRVLVRLLFHRPFIFVMLLLVYLTGVLVFFGVEPNKRGVVVAAFAGFATGGLAAVLTERIARHSLQAGLLGLPNHSRIMRLVQGWFLALFVAVPAFAATAFGASPLTAGAALTTAAALGIFLATYGGFWLVALPLLSKVVPLGDWLMLAPVQALIAALSAWLIWRWFELPVQKERSGALQPMLLADALHERAQPSEEATASEVSGAQSVAETAIENAVATAVGSLQSVPTVATALAFGFGYRLNTVWRGVWRGIAIALAVLLAWHLIYGTKSAAMGYWLVTGVCCVGLMGRVQGMLTRWISTSAEQALLQVTPRWPDAHAIKRAMILSTFLIQRGGLVFWAAVTAVAVLLGWIGRPELITGGVAVVAVSLAASGAGWAILAHRRVREWNLSTIVIVLTVAVGAAVIVFGAPLSHVALVVGLALVTLPPALALAWYWIAPLRLPLNVDPRALKALQ